MNRLLDRFLLGALWICAALLGACFWFNVRFGFNILSRAHWDYLTSAQLGGTKIIGSFYMSIAVSIAVALIGFYIILRPRFRKITPPEPIHHPLPSAVSSYVPVQNTTDSETSKNYIQTPVRPPRLETGQMQPNDYESLYKKSGSVVPQAPVVKPISAEQARLSKPDIADKIKNLVSSADYIIKPSPKMLPVTPTLMAIGGDEFLLVGLTCNISGDAVASEGGKSMWSDKDGQFESPVWMLSEIVEKMKALFIETLDDESPINLYPFVIIDGGKITNVDKVRQIWDAFGITVFESPDNFEKYINENRGHKIAPDDQEFFESYSGYIDTLIDYLNSQN